METVSKSKLKNGKILTGFRKQNHMTQAELGKIIGRDSRDISKYEKGFREIPQAAVDYLNSTYNLKLSSTGKVMKVIKSTKNYVIDFKKETKKKVSSLPAGKVYTPKSSVKRSVTTKTIKSTVEKTTVKGSTFGKRLTAYRESLGLTQKDFAKKYKFTSSSLSKLESGKSSTISIESLRALSKGVSIDALVR